MRLVLWIIKVVKGASILKLVRDVGNDLAKGLKMLKHLKRKLVGLRIWHSKGMVFSMSMYRIGVIATQQDIGYALFHRAFKRNANHYHAEMGMDG